MSERSKDYLEYKTWVVVHHKPSLKKRFFYFPDFDFKDTDIIPSVSEDVPPEERSEIIVNKMEMLICDAIKNGTGIKPAMAKSDVETIYGDNQKSLCSFNFYDLFDKAHRSKTDMPTLPAVINTNKNPINPIEKPQLDFWVIINEACDDYQKDTTKEIAYQGPALNYQISFPEIDKCRYDTVHAVTPNELYEKIDRLLLTQFEDWITLGGEPLEKWTEAEINEYYEDSDEIRRHTIDIDDYLDIVKRREVKTTQQKLIRRYPTNDHLRNWPPKPPKP